MREREFRDKKGAFKKYNKSAPLGQDPLPGKAIKIFFSTSPKILSPRFNLVSRDQIQLHYYTKFVAVDVMK